MTEQWKDHFDHHILTEILKIRYVKLHFRIQLLEDTILPKHKVSALRGGIGEMLLRANCIADRECEKCDFSDECIVNRTMYSKTENRPAFVTNGDSIGYVLECENYQEEFAAGDEFSFVLLLFGKTIVYFNQYVQAIQLLGMNGIGKYESKFQIIRIENTRRKQILDGNHIYMKNYQIETLSDYVGYRLGQLGIDLESIGRMTISLRFHTPLAVKYQGKELTDFHGEGIWNALRRRIYMLACFENMDADAFYRVRVEPPVAVCSDAWSQTVSRYSFRKEIKMKLKGICGTVCLQGIDYPKLILFLAGELIHVGKNTSFGFGRYYIEEIHDTSFANNVHSG